MNTFDKIRAYYAQNQEWARLDSPAGAFEKMAVLRLVQEQVPAGSHILDLGGGPGKMAIALANMGHRVSLVDISPELIAKARQEISERGLEAAFERVAVGNATALPELPSAGFDAILAAGPFYHLVEVEDRRAAAREVLRLCKPGGIVLVGFIPRFSGLAGLIGRASRSPEQVSAEAFQQVAETGVFHNQGESGFQEGYYPLVAEFVAFWEELGLVEINCVSTRSFFHQQEAEVKQLQQEHPALFQAISQAHQQLHMQPGFVEAGGHACLIGRKTE